MSQVLREYQSHALDKLRRGIAQGVRAQVLQLATGGGKTTIASAMAQSCTGKGKRFYFVVDSLELVDQAAARFMADGMRVGVIQGNHRLTDYSCPVQVATIQTLKNRWDDIAKWLLPDVVVIDECHVLHAAHETVIDWCRGAGVPVVGLSATPFRKGLGTVFDSLVVGATTASLTEQGYLVPAVCYAPFIPDLKGVKTTSGGDWQEDALAEYMGDAKIVGDVVKHWFRLGQGRQTIVFASNVAHSRLLCDAFLARGVKAAHVDGYEQDKDARTEKINAYRRGDIQVICNVAVLTKGFDAPETGCVVLARPTKSLMLHFQTMGRVLRPAPGKSDAIVIDHAGNCIRNGLPTDPLPEVLDDGTSTHNLDRKKREKSEPLETACVSCGYVSTRHTCPMCGFAPEKRENVEVRDGELYPLEKSDNVKEWPPERLAGLYAELLGYARAKGFKDGWAFHKAREYAGRAPKATKQIEPKEPSDKTLKIIQHLNIKNAKRRQAA